MVSILLAGCLGGDDLPEGDDNGATSGTAEFSEDTGALWGAISSAVFEPLHNARIEVLTMDRQLTNYTAITGGNGEFTISHVEPGEYIVFVTRVGYEATQRAVEVVAGEIAEVRLQLEPLPHDGPFREHFDWTGHVVYAVAWWVEPPVVGCQNTPSYNTCSGIRGTSTHGETRVGPDTVPDGWPGIQNSDFEESSLDNVKTLIMELDWTPAGPFGETLSFDTMCSDAPRGSGGSIEDRDHPCYHQETGHGPLIHRWDEQDWLENDFNQTGQWAARVFGTHGTLGTYDLIGIDIGAAYEQSFNKYWSIFHGEPAPEGYSGMPDA